ncbi:sulfatase [Verrucomicrobia bacterium]|jgi:arylsulfatase A-like enzyme|nr:sulfatase [Verrucomicrobiota bacterium]
MKLTKLIAGWPRRVILLSGTLLTGALFLGAAEERPNIVFLLSDDQATYSVGSYGNPDVQTPHLDRLAAQGLSFDHHYDTTAICMASRASIMTGMYEYKTGCNFEHGPMLREHFDRSYPVLLRQAGYRTAFAGKFGFEVSTKPNTRGVLPEGDFDSWGGGPGQTFYATAKNKSMARYAKDYPHATRSYGAFGSDFIKESAQSGKPFCLSISFKAPHRPVSPDPIDDEIYRGKKFKKPANYGREHGGHFARQSQQGRQYVRFSEWGYEDDYDRVMALYHQQIYAIDAAVGMIRKALGEAGVSENTVIIFTSDNGFLCGSHGYGSKVLPYEEASRVPLIIYDPRDGTATPGSRSEALTGNVDFAPTILDLAGLPVPKTMDGKSLLSLYRNPKASLRDFLPLINVWGPREVHSLAVVSKDYKYVFWNYGEGDYVPTEELYHLTEDRLELVNEATNSDHQQALQTLRGAYDRSLGDWKNQAVPYHKYQKYGVIFDREIPWSEKKTMLGQ